MTPPGLSRLTDRKGRRRMSKGTSKSRRAGRGVKGRTTSAARSRVRKPAAETAPPVLVEASAELPPQAGADGASGEPAQADAALFWPLTALTVE